MARRFVGVLRIVETSVFKGLHEVGNCFVAGVQRK
jgi:hypothetical protein